MKKDLKIESLPAEVINLLEILNAPTRLRRHLSIVHSTALELIKAFQENWLALDMDTNAILFGAATHDIGKIIITKELYSKGNLHEAVGYNLLLEQGFSPYLSRFAKTHGNWNSESSTLEDLLVTLSDKIWKGKRINELEEQISLIISQQLSLDFWETYQKLNLMLERISLSADEKLAWQNLEHH